MSDEFTPFLMVLRGAAILKRYRHPNDWKDGNQTGQPHLYGAKVLKVEEIRLGKLPLGIPSIPQKEAELNAQCLSAWARNAGLSPAEFQIDQRTDRAPYVYVPQGRWDEVLLLLQHL